MATNQSRAGDKNARNHILMGGPPPTTHDPTVFNIHIIVFNFKILDICFKMGGSDFQDHR